MESVHNSGFLLVRISHHFIIFLGFKGVCGSLKNHDIDIRPMWELGDVTMALPLEEKMTYEQGNSGYSYG